MREVGSQGLLRGVVVGSAGAEELGSEGVDTHAGGCLGLQGSRNGCGGVVANVLSGGACLLFGVFGFETRVGGGINSGIGCGLRGEHT